MDPMHRTADDHHIGLEEEPQLLMKSITKRLLQGHCDHYELIIAELERMLAERLFQNETEAKRAFISQIDLHELMFSFRVYSLISSLTGIKTELPTRAVKCSLRGRSSAQIEQLYCELRQSDSCVIQQNELCSIDSCGGGEN
jgi:hypothetical protein